jgi:hypothetical protein
MVLQVIKVKLDMDNIESFSVPEDHIWNLNVVFPSTGETRSGVQLSTNEEVDIPNSRGTANLVIRVEKNVYATLKIDATSKSVKPEVTEEDSEKGRFVPLLAIECRGCEIESWAPTGYYRVTSRSGHVFEEVDLSQGEWYEVDPETNEPVSLVSIESRIERLKD